MMMMMMNKNQPMIIDKTFSKTDLKILLNTDDSIRRLPAPNVSPISHNVLTISDTKKTRERRSQRERTKSQERERPSLAISAIYKVSDLAGEEEGVPYKLPNGKR